MKKKNRRRRARAVFQLLRRALRVGCIGLAIAAGGLVAARAAIWIEAHPYFAVREIDVETKGRLDAQTLVSWAGLTPGMSVWEAGEAAAEARLLAHPRIRAASVERRFPGQVIVRVEERTPVAVLFADRPLLVARDGVAFPPLAGEETGDLPYVTGLAGEDPTSAPVASRLREAARVATAWREREQWPAISEIRPGDGEMVVFVAGTPLAIRFATEAGSDDFARLDAVLDLWRGREIQVAAIDLTAPGEAVLTMRNPKKAAAHPSVRAS